MLYFCNSYKWYPYCVIGAVYLAEGGLGTCPVLSVRDSIRLHHLVAMIGPIFDGQYCHVVLGLLYMNCDIAYIYDNLKGRGILNLWFIVISTDLRHTKYPTSRCDQSYGILICKYYQIIRTNIYACCNILMSTTWILRQENLFSSRAREESLDTIKRQNSPL